MSTRNPHPDASPAVARPKVFITGAAGELGTPLGNHFVAAGWEVVGCDLRGSAVARFPIAICDLATAQSGDLDLTGCDTVVHLANHADEQRAPAARILTENAAMNRTVFAAATAARVRTFVFASTMQVFRGPCSAALGDVEYLPLDGDLAFRYPPTNAYAASKSLAEVAVRELAVTHPERAWVVLRMPRVVHAPRSIPRVSITFWQQPERGEGYSYLLLDDFSRLVLAIARARLVGFRCYFPAAHDNTLGLPAAEVIARHYVGVPLRAAGATIDALVDTRAITGDTGWQPTRHPRIGAAPPPADWTTRILARAARLEARAIRVARGIQRRLWLRQHTFGTAQLVLGARAMLGEGPLWRPREQRLYWVDIDGQRLHRFDPATGDDEEMPLGESVSAVFDGPDSQVLVALQFSLAWVDFAARSVTPHASGRIEGPPNRFNDGKRDATGRIWIGSMHMHSRRRSGTLFAVESDGRVTPKVEAVGCSNGLAWSRDGRTLYFVDSFDRRIDSFAFDPGTGNLGNRSTLLAIPPGFGTPDGMCADAEGKLWVALAGVGLVVHVDPVARRMLGAVRVPVRNVTSCAFGGPDLATLYITTARAGLTPEALARQPDAGGLFAFRPTVPGQRTERANWTGVSP